MKKNIVSLMLLSAMILGGCSSPSNVSNPAGEAESKDGSKPQESQSIEQSSPAEEIDPDDQWEEEEEGEEGEDPDELPKEGEKYESYVSNTPSVKQTMPVITVSLSEGETGSVPRMENTYLTTARREDKGDYYGCTVTINEGDATTMEDVACQIKVRGNYTSNYSKKPYRLKFSKKQAMPGFDGKFKNWVLLADVKDHSNLRNLLSFYLGDTLFNTYGDYSSHYQPVELNFIDGTGETRYWGTYLLCEQQEIKGGRVDITDVGDLPEGVEDGSYNGTDIGYFIEYDGYFTDERGGSSFGFLFNDRDFAFSIDDGSATGGDPTFTIPYNNRATFGTYGGGNNRPRVPGFTLKGDVSSDDPSAQLNFISHYMENVYTILFNATYNNRFMAFNDDYSAVSNDASLNSQTAIEKVIDVDSLVNMYILQEIACDGDIDWSSFYMNVDFGANAKDHLLRFDAPWDFDGAYGLTNSSLNSGEGAFAATHANPWLSIIMNNEWFRNKVSERYNELYSYDVLKNMLLHIDEITSRYEEAYARNITRWGSRDETNEVRQDWARLQTQPQHAEALRGWLKTRLNYLARTWLNGYDVETHVKSSDGSYTSEGNVALLENGNPQRFEAEEAEISRRLTRNSDGHGASENGYVGALNNSGESITFRINATKRKQAYFTARFAKGMSASDFNSTYDVTINGEPLKVRNIPIDRMGNNNWYDWVTVNINSSWLEEGENVITFTSKANATNFDYLEIYSKDALSWAD